jgi:alkanesulfonate monooxygenase SsuD/methylene tetrahydromethanopterin reductase-like flavin-dependent oxidoreductase (luciferase family)
MLEGWSVLNALARETSKVKLATQVTGITYRNPALLAKMATTLDVISGGRAVLGLGAAWNEEEHIAFGYDFPSVKERMDRLDEGLAIARAMFRGENPTVDGHYYRVHHVINSPPPVQASGPRIMVGGGGEQRTLRIAAKYADITHWFPLGLPALKHKDELLVQYCQDVGRDPSTIERAMNAPVVITSNAALRQQLLQRIPEERRPFIQFGAGEEAADQLRPYLDAGFTGFTFNNNLYATPEAIGEVGEVLRLIGG